MQVYGLEHVQAAARDRPILIVANHRSFFDMYTVSTALFRNTSWRKQLFFPVRGRFFCLGPLGLFLNLVMGWWSMYPPFFATGDKPIPKASVRQILISAADRVVSSGAGNVIGFHPEGTRNKGWNPYYYLRPQPGVGKLIKDAAPQVIPVFIAGLGNDLPKQVLGNWTGGEKISRIHFGPQIDFLEFLQKRDHVRTHLEIAQHVMRKIAELGERDREGQEAGLGGRGRRRRRRHGQTQA